MKDIGWRYTEVNSLQGVTLHYFIDKKVHTGYKIVIMYYTKGEIWVAPYSDLGRCDLKKEKQFTRGQYKSYRRVQFLPSRFQRKVLKRLFGDPR